MVCRFFNKGSTATKDGLLGMWLLGGEAFLEEKFRSGAY